MVGIAAGVALLFASQVASQSLSSSVAELSHGIVGNATLQLLARDPHGMPENLLARVRATAGVRVAAPLLEASAQANGPHGRASVELVGADSSLRALGGALVRHTELEPFAGIGAILLPAPLARRLGVTRFGREVTLQLYGRSEQAPLYEQLHEKQIGALVASPIVIAPLFFAQEMTGLAGRVSRILVETAPGMGSQVRSALSRLAAGRLNVQSTDYDERLFAKAASASNQSTALFAVISALVGIPVRIQRDAVDRSTAQAADSRSAARRLHARHGDRGVARRRAGTGCSRLHTGSRARRRALDPTVPRQPRIPGLRVRGRHATRDRGDQHRDRRRRRHARRAHRRPEPAPRHPLARPRGRDHSEAGFRRRPHRCSQRIRGARVPGSRDGDTARRSQAGDRRDGAADRRAAACAAGGAQPRAGPAHEARTQAHGRGGARRGDGARVRRALVRSASRRRARSRCSARSRSRAPTAIC